MLGDFLSASQIYLACGKTDMRKSIDGLAALVQQKFKLDPSQPALFLFSGRWGDCVFSLIVAALVLYAHRGNIERLMRGEEKSWVKR